MGFLDKFKGRSGELRAKAQGLAGQHGDKIGQGLDKAGDAVNKATKGKHGNKIDNAVHKAKDGVRKYGDAGGPEGSAGDRGGPTGPPGSGPGKH